MPSTNTPLLKSVPLREEVVLRRFLLRKETKLTFAPLFTLRAHHIWEAMPFLIRAFARATNVQNRGKELLP